MDNNIIHYKKDCFNEPYCSLREVIEELSRKTNECEELRKERNRFKKQYRKNRLDRKKLEQKLERIKDRCNETLELMDKDSGTNAYAGGRCTEAGQILQIVEGDGRC